MRLIKFLFALFAVSLSSAAAAENHWCEQLAGLQASPPVWIARDSDTTLILVATIHVLPPQTNWRSKMLDDAIRSADELVVDTSVASKEEFTRALARHAFSSTLPPLRDRIQPDLLPSVLAVSELLKTSPTNLDRIKTWALAFLVMANQKGTCETGISLQLENEFGRAKRGVVALQTADMSLSDFDALPESAQAQLVKQAVRPAKDELYRAMIRSWAAGDLEASAAAAQADMGNSPAILAMLSRQKLRFGGGLVRLMMAEPGTKLVVLGALDFTGRDSVLQQLREHGIRVRRVQ